MKSVYVVHKEIGETPLECLERTRKQQGISPTIPMTYAGRLDPLAQGILVILVGDECKNKQKYLCFDKEYEIEVLFGIETDTYDQLGVILKVDPKMPKKVDIQKYVGKFEQTYPMYSSKTVQGKQLHQYARNEQVPEDMPTKEVEIFSLENLGEREVWGAEIAQNSIDKVAKVKGNFRQEKILKKWQEFGQNYGQAMFKILALRVKCSSGTYMRTLAQNMGKGAGVGAVAYSINRTKIFGDF